MKYFKDFILMIQFFTRIPINMSVPCEKENFKRGAAFLPVVGLILGGMQYIFFYLTKNYLPVSVIAVFVVLIPLVVTGGFHIDGLGDTCDGFFAFKGKEKIIEIMKDSRIGTYACMAIVFDILFKYTLYNSLFLMNVGLPIVFAPVATRFGTFFLALISKPAKATGTGNFFIGNMGKPQFIICTMITLGIGYFTVGAKIGVITLIVDILLTMWFYKFCVSKIDGITGDGCGANNEILEIFNLILLTILI